MEENSQHCLMFCAKATYAHVAFFKGSFFLGHFLFLTISLFIKKKTILSLKLHVSGFAYLR